MESESVGGARPNMPLNVNRLKIDPKQTVLNSLAQRWPIERAQLAHLARSSGPACAAGLLRRSTQLAKSGLAAWLGLLPGGPVTLPLGPVHAAQHRPSAANPNRGQIRTVRFHPMATNRSEAGENSNFRPHSACSPPPHATPSPATPLQAHGRARQHRRSRSGRQRAEARVAGRAAVAHK